MSSWGDHRYRQATNNVRWTVKHAEVPLYRSYGVTRRKRPVLERIGTGIALAVALWILWLLLLSLVLGLVAFLMHGDMLVVVLVYVLAICLTLFLGTRTLRKRLKLLRGLKRMVRKQNYRLEQKKKGPTSFFWTAECPDYVLHTRKECYRIYFLTVKKYNSALFFEGKDTLKLVTYPLNNIFSIILGRKPKERFYPLLTEQAQTEGLRSPKRVILLNPTCRELYDKDRDGELVATGSGAEFAGYTLYTGSAFLEAVRRGDGLK